MNEQLDSRGFIRNLAIMASAGTGKTYQLAMRYILLILRGARPEEIVAVTFTRKAAGEIFEKIMSLLLELIFSGEKLHSAVQDGFLPQGTTSCQLISVLQKILTCRKHLHIETNDSFLMQTIQSAPAQFGIMGKISMLDEEDDRPRKRALLQALHAPEFASANEESCRKRQDIYMILRDSSMGAEHGTLCSEITALLKKFYPLYLEHPCREDWSLRIPPARSNDLLSGRDLSVLVQKIRTLLEDPFYDPLREKKLTDKFFAVLECASLTSREFLQRASCNELKFFLGEEAKLPVFSEPADDVIPFNFNRKEYQVKRDLFLQMRKVIRHMAGSEFLLINRKTRAVYDLMAYFDRSYAIETRHQGFLTFQDILYLINNMERRDYGILQILRERLALNIDHYLLDEFQDTSDSQWGAFQDLVSDVIQWNEESRFTSFFMVADVKQSLYQWRKGDPEIFRRICCDYAILPEEKFHSALETGEPCSGMLKGLNRSFRSTQPVLQMVNDIFDPDRDLFLPERLESSTEILNVQRRAMDFVPHVSGLKKERASSGCSMFLEVGNGEDRSDTACIRTICDMIRAMKLFSPERSGKLSVAVLARKNDQLQEFYETAARYAPELSVSMEGRLSMTDSMCYALFRQILIYAMHPGDQSCCGFFSTLRTETLSPCSEEEIQLRLYPQNNRKLSLRTLIRSELDEGGYYGFFRHFCAAFPECSKEQEYMDALEEILRNMGEETISSADELLQKLDLCSGPLSSRSSTVQLMTVHKSKGLGFDVVFYLGISGQTGRDNFSGECSDGSLYFQPEKIWQECSAELTANWQEQSARGMYDFCCNLYVALTRAKYAQYFVTEPEKAETRSHTLTHADVLRSALYDRDHHVPPERTDRFISALRKIAVPDGEDAGAGENPDIKCSYCAGDPLWYEEGLKEKTSSSSSGSQELSSEAEKNPYPGVERAIADEKAFFRKISARPLISGILPGKVLRSRAPSSHKLPAAMRFLSMKGAELGSRLHEIFSRISFFSAEEDVRAFTAQYREDEHVYKILEHAFSRQEFLELFLLKDPGKERVRLLVEQPFLMQGENSSVINGIMDRAVIYLDRNGHAVSGEVLDFKTDLLESAGEFQDRYRDQLEIYRKALSLISSLPLEKISCVILAVRKGMVIRF